MDSLYQNITTTTHHTQMVQTLTVWGQTLAIFLATLFFSLFFPALRMLWKLVRAGFVWVSQRVTITVAPTSTTGGSK
jgi:hypothetical protein